MAMRYPGGFISSTAPTVNANTAKGVWTLEEAMQYIRAGQWPVPTGNGDPYFQYNTMLLPGQGTNGAQNNTFLDSSSNNFTITRNGNTTQGTFTPFSGTAGNWSNFFDGSGDYFTSSTSLFNYTTGNASNETFTIEAYIYHNARSTPSAVQYAQSIAAKGDVYLNFGINGTGNLIFYHYDGSTRSFTGSSVIPLNQWTHVAVRVTGGTATLYVNGVSDGSGTWYGIQAAGLTATSYFGTPALNASALAFNGFTSNLRISNNARTITVPTAPYSNDANTVFLTSQSNRFIDNSSNAYAITPVGGVAVTPFQPFGAPTVAYSASTIGGSGYFDGALDYLTASSNAAFTYGTGAFTIEGWHYLTAASSSTKYLFDQRVSGQGLFPAMYIDAGSYVLYINSAVALTAGTVRANSWVHWALVKNGSTTTLYINGTSVGSVTDNNNYSTTAQFRIGSEYSGAGTYDWQGYLADVRVVKGTAVYTANFTPPTAPLTAITNTSLLCNFTNAGIIDNAQDNNLETVGNAQISTTQYKWGASSVAFDGTTDYLIPNGSTTNLFAFGSGAFTIEMWFYVTSFPNQYVALYDSRPASTNGFYPVISLENNGSVYFYVNSANAISSGSGVISTGRWYHLAVVKAGSSTKMFVNGNQVGSTYADTNTYLIAANRPVIGASGFTLGNDSLNGYIQDLRVTKGYARYPYNFTAPTAAFPLFYQAAATPSSDPYFDYTTLLLPGNGTNGAQNNTFLDSSTNNFSITRNGNTTQGTFTPFSQTGWGNYFSATGDNLRTGVMTPLGSGDFTLECWINPSSFANYRLIWDNRTSDPDANGFAFGLESSGKVYLYTNSGFALTTSGVVVANAWTHIALVRSATGSGNVKIYINGIADSTTATNTANFSRTQAYVGNDLDGTGNPFVGYISNMRATTGALYTSNFTPSTSPLTTTVSAGTCVLLTCQSNRFVDNSASAVSITVAGASVQAFSPFNPTASYSTSTVGGSGYFDGTGDYLTSASIGTSIGTGDFSLEAWVYTGSAATTFAGLISLNNSAGYPLYLQTSGNAARFLDFQNPGTNFVISGGTVNSNAWVHIVGTRQSGTIRLFVDGKLAAYQAGVTFNYGTAGTSQISGTIAEYISDSRIVIGSVPTAYQTSSTTTGAQIFTPPTAPLTAVTNTQLLLSYTNGGIIDNTAKNNLETVGGASISTTVSKFGGSSMYFDGSGDWLLMPAGDKFAFGTGDYTVEAWVYFTSITTTDLQIIFLSGSTGGNNFYFHVDGNQISVGTSAAFISNQATSFSTATWYHVAACRYSGTLRLFVNGVQIGSSVSDTTNWISAGSARIGANESGTQTVFGYINDHRVTKGIARYTTNFTPPTTAFLTL